MSYLRREVLKGIVQHKKRGTGQWKKRTAIAYCGGPGGAVAQVELFEDSDDIKVKAKRTISIPLADAKIDALSQPSTPNDSSTQGSVVSGTSPRSDGLSLANKFEFHITSGTEKHEFKCESEEDRASWVKLLGLLVLFPTAHIPEEPLDNPIKYSFRNKLTTKKFRADSVWPVFILAEEVSTRLNIIGLHILVLRGGVSNQTVGSLEIVSPADTNNAVVSWERDKLRRTGKTGNLVFVEIGRRCKGGPGLVWLYTGVEQAQSLRETLHNFLFHGDGKAIGMPVQQKVPAYDTPKPSEDSLPPFYNRRCSASTSSGYQSQTNVISPTSTSGSPSVRSEPVPPVNLDHHPSRLGRQISATCDINPSIPRRTVSQQIGSTSHTYHTPCSSCHSDDPAFFDGSFLSEEDLGTGYPSGQLDPEVVYGPQSQRRSASMPSVPSANRGHSQNRWDTTATCQAPRGGVSGGGSSVSGDGGDVYEQMVHPALAHKSLYNDPDYVYMHSAVSRIPDIQSPAPNYSNYDFVPAASSRSTISEVERPTPYENHPLPRDLQGVAPITFQPKYENVEAARRSKAGSTHSDLYENVLMNGEQLAGTKNVNGRIYENLQQTLSGEGLRYSQVGMHAKEEAVNPSVTRVTYNTIDVRSSNVIHTLQRERSIERGIRP